MSANDIKAFETIEARRKQFPNKGLRELFQGSGVNPAAYYRGRGATKGKKAKRQPVAAATRKTKNEIKAFETDNHMMLLIGTPAQMRDALTGHL